ncbi:MAG: ATP-dependent 6-phosphofructokinase [Candidatus Altiarchaeales archaeon]|nr:ATP-dependent 6-phosphofructokinase [Candidatus Altiarchaeales archaeon]MBD3416256.1 ATP-dependent 6-phosphofructokinase [Candidatus Altiarchaeales archaeon]
MKVGILTGGGDCPGLNAAIRAVVRKGMKDYGMEFVGVRDGWKGMIEAEYFKIDRNIVSGLLVRGGTMLGSSRTNPMKMDDGIDKVKSGFEKMGLDALIAIGGDDTLGVAAKMAEAGLKVIGIPKTIDNDLLGTERTIGFNTALTVVVDAIDRLHTTAESHHRVMILEVMGRHAGWIAVMGGIAGGADLILIPEKPFKLDDVCDVIRKRHETRSFTIVVVAEGAVPEGGSEVLSRGEKDSFGHVALGGIGEWLRKEIKEKLGFDTRATKLGHVQRGGTPTVADRLLATRFGVKACELAGKSEFGVMVALKGDEIVPVPLSEAVKDRVVDDEWYGLAETFFG